MLSRHSHVRTKSKRRALDEMGARQRTADERRQDVAERRRQIEAVSQSAVIQIAPVAA
jgi:hypothetical protein